MPLYPDSTLYPDYLVAPLPPNALILISLLKSYSSIKLKSIRSLIYNSIILPSPIKLPASHIETLIIDPISFAMEPATKSEEKETIQVVKKIGNFVFDVNSEPLGQGAFAKVYKGWEYKKDPMPVAVKVVSSENLNKYGKRLDILQREIEVLKKIKGKNILEFKDALSSESGNIYIITTFFEEGNLSNALKSAGGKLSVGKSLKILSDISNAFCEIKALKLTDSSGNILTMMHRDLKPENILMDKGSAILADFGFAKFISEQIKEEQVVQTLVGTESYMSPQLLKKEPYSYKTDIWSMGIMTYELMFGITPWDSTTKIKFLEEMKNVPLSFPEEVPEDVQDLLQKMLALEEKSRPDWTEILEHPAIKNYAAKE